MSTAAYYNDIYLGEVEGPVVITEDTGEEYTEITATFEVDEETQSNE